MLKTLAHAGAGAYEYFDSKTKSRWEGRIKSQLEKASQPVLTEVRIEWEQHGHHSAPVQAPTHITSLFNGSRLVVYGFVPNCFMVSTSPWKHKSVLRKIKFSLLYLWGERHPLLILRLWCKLVCRQNFMH